MSLLTYGNFSSNRFITPSRSNPANLWTLSTVLYCQGETPSIAIYSPAHFFFPMVSFKTGNCSGCYKAGRWQCLPAIARGKGYKARKRSATTFITKVFLEEKKERRIFDRKNRLGPKLCVFLLVKPKNFRPPAKLLVSTFFITIFKCQLGIKRLPRPTWTRVHVGVCPTLPWKSATKDCARSCSITGKRGGVIFGLFGATPICAHPLNRNSLGIPKTSCTHLPTPRLKKNASRLLHLQKPVKKLTCTWYPIWVPTPSYATKLLWGRRNSITFRIPLIWHVRHSHAQNYTYTHFFRSPVNTNYKLCHKNGFFANIFSLAIRSSRTIYLKY